MRYKNRFKWHIESRPKVYLASFKSEIDRLGIGKLETNPGDLSKLSNVGKNEILKNWREWIGWNCYSGWPCRQFNQINNNTKVSEIEKKTSDNDHSIKYITTKDFNNFRNWNYY